MNLGIEETSTSYLAGDIISQETNYHYSSP